MHARVSFYDMGNASKEDAVRAFDQARDTGEQMEGNEALSTHKRHGVRRRPDNAYEVEPGHDAWVVGDEPYVALEFERKTAEEYAKR